MADNCKLCRIALENVSVVRGGQTLLQDVSMHIHCGQLTVLIGQNGAGKTTLLIAHRISTVEQLDKIVFIEDGRVEAVGPHDELYRTCNEYRRMVDLQKLEDEVGGDGND